MLGRKAILHSSRPAKRKWQVEQEKDSDAESSDKELAANEQGADQQLGTNGGTTEISNPEAASGGSKEAVDTRGAEGENEDSEDEKDDEGGAKRKRFAWMDSDDEVSDGDEEHAANKTAAPVSDIVAPPKLPIIASVDPGSSLSELLTKGAKMLTSLRSGPSPPTFSLPPGCAILPVLSKEHLSLLAQIAAARTLSDFWELIEKRCQDFAAAHASIALHRVATLAGGNARELAVEKHRSFGRLSDRVDELIATEQGRASFLPADLAVIAVSLAKIVPLPATEGAVGRIFADIADEAESRIISKPSTLTTSMLADLVWGISKSGNSKMCFLRTIVDAAVPRMSEMTCQDIATLATAFEEQTLDEAEVVVHGAIQQVKQRLGHRPPMPSLTQLLANAGQTAPGVASPVGASASSEATPTAPEASIAPCNGEANGALDNEAEGVKEKEVISNRSKPLNGKLPAWQLTGDWRFSCGQISDIAWAASRRVSLYDEGFFTLVAQHFQSRLQEFNGIQLQKIREAYELMRHDVNGEFMKGVRSAQLLPRNRLSFGSPSNLLDSRPRMVVR